MCRAYLSHYEDENGARTIGRCNIGAVSLNVPVIMAVAKREFGNDWKSKFWTLLDSRLETIREFLKKRYDIIRHTKASTNPLAFTQGGFYKGYLKPDDEIGDLVKYMTASFGITALNESTILWNGKTLYEDKSQFANKVVDFILDRIEKYKKADGYLYALYGTPAESLCFSGETIVQAYPENKRIDEIKEGDYVYSLNPDLKTRELKKVTFAGKTGTNCRVVKVTTDNGQEFICTPNHKFAIRNMLHDGNKFDGENIKWVEAKDLKAGDRLKSNYITIDSTGHYKMHGVYVHDIVAETFLGKKKDGYCVHHKSLNKLDNNVENLEYLTESEHKSLHWKLNNPNKGQLVGELNNFFGKIHSKESLLKNRNTHMKGSVAAFDLNNRIVYQYECAQDAVKDGFNASAIRRCCGGLYNDTCTYKGYTWAFYPYEQNHKVVSVEFLEDTYDVYDITVEDNHNFFVGGDEGVLVHNCMKQAQQYKNLTGDNQFGEYFSNSFHCHVSEHITPIEKQDAEFNLFHKVAGGHIQYVRIDNPENLVALKTIIERGMEMGFYQGVNFNITKCNECGQTSYNSSLKCPHCGSTNTSVISRVCGYLGYSNLNGQTRMNDGKMCEIKDRVSM